MYPKSNNIYIYIYIYIYVCVCVCVCACVRVRVWLERTHLPFQPTKYLYKIRGRPMQHGCVSVSVCLMKIIFI